MFQNMKIYFDYFAGTKKNSAIINKDSENSDFICYLRLKQNDSIENLVINIVPKKEITIEKLYIRISYSFNGAEKIFSNGYQSWTDSREFSTHEKMKSISKLAKPLMKKYQFDKYGDYTFKKYSGKTGEFHGYTYSYIRENDEINLIGSLTEKNGYTIIEEHVKKNEIIIEKDCRDLRISHQYTAFELVSISGSEEAVFDKYFEVMNISKPKCKPLTGWTSWYNYYQHINQDVIIENLMNFRKLHEDIDIFQIDDGYQTAVGDWLSVDISKFPKGMKYISNIIKAQGYKSGIWLAPFVCETNSQIYREKKQWLLKDSNGDAVMAGSNWSGFYALDFYNDEVRDYIRNVFSVILNEWDYDMVKLDFLYAVCLIPQKNKTRGEIMTEAMKFLRECVSDKLILGCGVPLGPAFGQVDYCRIGCDVSLDWDNKFYMKLFHRERTSTLNAIRNSIGRSHLNGRAFLNDPDVFLLRDDNITLTKVQKETLSMVNHIFGSLLFTSDNIKKYDANKQIMFHNIMNLKPKKIEKVTSYDNGLVEVVFTENNIRYLGVINTGNRQIRYENKVNLDNHQEQINPYETRIFSIITKELF